MVWLDAVAQPLQLQAILAYECAQISAIIDSISRIEIFQMDGVEISIIDDPGSSELSVGDRVLVGGCG